MREGRGKITSIICPLRMCDSNGLIKLNDIFGSGTQNHCRLVTQLSVKSNSDSITARLYYRLTVINIYHCRLFFQTGKACCRVQAGSNSIDITISLKLPGSDGLSDIIC